MKITKSKEWYHWASIIAFWAAWVCCVAPTLIVGLVNLPLFKGENGDQTLTGVAVLMLICCAYPILKGLLQLLKNPSAWLIMTILAVIVTCIYNVAHATLAALVAVLWAGAIGNIAGAILFFLSAMWKEKCKYCGEITLANGGNNGTN